MQNFGKMMKQAKELQSKMKQMQDELASVEVEASAGGGMVTVRINGQQEVLGIKIEPEVFNDGDREMLEDLIVAALGEARRKALDLTKEQMKTLTGGLPIPGFF